MLGQLGGLLYDYNMGGGLCYDYVMGDYANIMLWRLHYDYLSWGVCYDYVMGVLRYSHVIEGEGEGAINETH